MSADLSVHRASFGASTPTGGTTDVGANYPHSFSGTWHRQSATVADQLSTTTCCRCAPDSSWSRMLNVRKGRQCDATCVGGCCRCTGRPTMTSASQERNNGNGNAGVSSLYSQGGATIANDGAATSLRSTNIQSSERRLKAGPTRDDGVSHVTTSISTR